jgi:cystathionine beta-synthase
LADQYDNPANPLAHVRTTGPEIWQQTEGRVTHFLAGVGTGGTISGGGRYLKEVSGGRVRVIGADPENSTYSGGDGSPYNVESIGHFLHPETEEDTWPESFHGDVVDWFERIRDWHRRHRQHIEHGRPGGGAHRDVKAQPEPRRQRD